jgi:hypothetical protein
MTLPGLKSDPSVVQPVASRYTDWATPAPLYSLKTHFFCKCQEMKISRTIWRKLLPRSS